MDGYYAFSDECGQYQQFRTPKSIRAHPFYVRVSAIIKLSDYIALENHADCLKRKYMIPAATEVKWAELGQRFKGRISSGMEAISEETLKHYVTDMVEYAVTLKSLQIICTVFDNSVDYQASEVSMLKMHIQNALQRIQHDMELLDGFATMIIDDIDDRKNRSIKEICHQLMQNGDFVNYSRVKKSILVDYSHHCAGLQLADFCAGIITSCLKRIKYDTESNYIYVYSLFASSLYKKVRYNDNNPPNFTAYGYGIREVPNKCGKELCQEIAKEIDGHLYSDLMKEIYE